MRVIGLTGGIASGKSAVAGFLSPYAVIDADQVARHVVLPGSEGLERVAQAFGPDILKPDGSLDRMTLRNLIATDREKQQQLNGILHPLIRQRIVDTLARLNDSVAFVDAALMLETGSYRNYEKVILVTAPEALRLARLKQRDGMPEHLARALMAKQWPDQRKRELADVEIINNGDLETLRQRTHEALQTLNIPLPLLGV